MGQLGIDVYIIRIFEYIRISYANIRIPISAFVDIPSINGPDDMTKMLPYQYMVKKKNFLFSTDVLISVKVGVKHQGLKVK